MKKNTILTAIVWIMLLGCSEKLDIRPKGKLILSTVEEYSKLLDYKYNLSYDTRLPWFACFDAGASFNTVNGNNDLFRKACFLGDASINRINEFKSDPLYSDCYERISNYNVILDNIMDAKGTEREKMRTIAEARLLRAYNYFVLVNTFCKHYNKSTAKTDGGLLMRTSFSLEEMAKQVSVEEVYRQIESDITSALPYVDSKGRNVNHPGLAFGYALKAKVHLFKQEFDEAETAANESLKHNSYIFDWVAWDEGPKPAPEIRYDNEENLYFGYGNVIEFAYPLSATIGPTLSQKYTPGDLRKERFFLGSSISNIPGCIYFKAYADIIDGKSHYRKIKFNEGGMRVSEVVLMLAECYIRSGKIAEGMQQLNDFRKKRVLPESYAPLVASNKDEAFNHVMEERSRELIATPNNFYDIRRLEVEGIHQSVERVIPDETVPEGVRRIVVKSDSHVFVMPFPENAFVKSSLTQNVDK